VVAGVTRGEAIVALGATLLLGACAFLGDALRGPRDRIAFSHKEHVKSDKKTLEECSGCHFATPKDPRGEEPILPSEASCLACHGDWKTKNECSKCHTDVSSPKTYAKDPILASIKFSHSRHVDRVARLEEKPCAYCHDEAWSSTTATSAKVAPAERMDRWHQSCFRCHLMRTEWDRLNCEKCHERVSDHDGPKPASRFNHGPGWLGRHGDELEARPDGLDSCAKCHDRGYCADCHDARNDRRVRPELKYPERPDRAFIHRGDYVNRHFIEARTDPSTCLRCHGTPFCRDCHEQRGLTPDRRAVKQGSDRTGPDGKTGIEPYHRGSFAELVLDTKSPFFHGLSARRARDALRDLPRPGALDRVRVLPHRRGGAGSEEGDQRRKPAPSGLRPEDLEVEPRVSPLPRAGRLTLRSDLALFAGDDLPMIGTAAKVCAPENGAVGQGH
jgi:hypothetical protein